MAKSLSFTDKRSKKRLLSVKCVLLTDKSAKNGALSVNSSEISVSCPKRKKIRTITGTDFHHYSVVAFGSTPCIIGFRLTTPLSQAPLLGQDELTRRKRDLDTRGMIVRLHTLYNQVPARIPPIESKDSLDETSSPSVAQSLRTGS